MPFPFFPEGAIVAVAVLGVVLVAFGLALKAIDRAVTLVTSSIAAGLVSGLQGWASEDSGWTPASGSPASASPDDGSTGAGGPSGSARRSGGSLSRIAGPSGNRIDELPEPLGIPLHRVARR